MTRETLKGKQTPGDWVAPDPGMVWSRIDNGQVADTRGTEGAYFAPCGLHQLALRYLGCGGESRPQAQRHANALLIAEAGTVANRTGMWPEDMAARIAELEGAEALVVMAEDPDGFSMDPYVVAHIPHGYDQEQAISDCLERQEIANACIDWFNEARAKALIEAERTWPDPQEKEIERPKWMPGLAMSEITREMRAERDAIDAHNESIRQKALEAFSRRNEYANNLALEQTKGKYPAWAVDRAANRKHKTNRKYTVSRVRSIQAPNVF